MADQNIRPPAPHGASPEGPVGGATGAFDFLPPNFDWKSTALDTVRRHPVPCLLAAAAVGFYIGRHRGGTIAAAAAGLATNAVMRELNKVFVSEEF